MTPFFRWPGGKRRQAEVLHSLIPPLGPRSVYWEPFAGAAALFWKMQPERAVLLDLNKYLVRAYTGLRDGDVSEIAELYNSVPQDRATYALMRGTRPEDDASPEEHCAWFLYINAVGFNGLWRENKMGALNTPFGDGKPKPLNESKLRICQRKLQGVQIRVADFRIVQILARAGDVLYFDPPYLPVKDDSFTAYNRKGFPYQDHIELAELGKDLHKRGCDVIISNSGGDSALEVFREYQSKEIEAPRTISSDPSKRGSVKERIFWL